MFEFSFDELRLCAATVIVVSFALGIVTTALKRRDLSSIFFVIVALCFVTSDQLLYPKDIPRHPFMAQALSAVYAAIAIGFIGLAVWARFIHWFEREKNNL